jgi:predicted negative regulator of RcsB-dependent stress response
MRIHPDEPNAYDSMGDLLVEMGDTEGAKEMYNKAAEMHPDFAEVSAAKAAKL